MEENNNTVTNKPVVEMTEGHGINLGDASTPLKVGLPIVGAILVFTAAKTLPNNHKINLG
mgnify:FL=1